MGSDAFEVQEPSRLRSVKVHLNMCEQLLRLVDRISSIFPHIEAARPGGRLGMQALCLLRKAIERAGEIVQNCCDSSKLYLAITGDSILRRFQKTKSLFVQSLSNLQSMVPVLLAAQICEVLDSLQAAEFSLDLEEAVAGKALRALIERTTSPINSVENSVLEILQFSASVLHISSQRDILVEQRSIKKLLRETNEGDSTKRGTLKYLSHILKKYDKLIVQGQTRGPGTQNGRIRLPLESDSESVPAMTPELNFRSDHEQDGARASIHHSHCFPEEFKCYLSSTLMHDPVKISSGHTFERRYIQKWFDEGHDTCPKSKLKLSHLSVIPDNSMRELILNWSAEHNAINQNLPSLDLGSLYTSSNSICSTASSMVDLHLQVDISSLSIGSFDSSYNSMSDSRLGDNSWSVKEVSDVDVQKFLFYHSNDDIKRQLLSEVNGLPWESQCKAIQDVYNYLNLYNPSCSFASSENFVDPLLRFMQVALDNHDVEAQKAGIQLLWTFLKASRTDASQINKDVYTLLASFLATEAITETLAIIEVLSTQPNAIAHFTVSGVQTPLINLLFSRDRGVQETAITILYNLSKDISASSCSLTSEWIPKLVHLLECDRVAGACIGILENLCRFDDTRVVITQTEGCIASIIELIQNGSSKDTQERAIRILLNLCSQRTSYCHLVLREGGLPALMFVSINGNDGGKIAASELFRLLKEIELEPEQECSELVVDDDNAADEPPETADKKSSKTSRSFRWSSKLFSKKK